ncbi:uncharacterized protein LOC116981574 isoform X2 [Amblyraja radiata]|uniref:uncharacterized protein LOC116981574 isoform X2 n=1 Tax=Amblyraja radiata TaxID=386614 RepID=UPI001402799E|nr:uncharacterized protein LOC116981574 isoform X2 [Amblyraja radiata]
MTCCFPVTQSGNGGPRQKGQFGKGRSCYNGLQPGVQVGVSVQRSGSWICQPLPWRPIYPEGSTAQNSLYVAGDTKRAGAGSPEVGAAKARMRSVDKRLRRIGGGLEQTSFVCGNPKLHIPADLQRRSVLQHLNVIDR